MSPKMNGEGPKSLRQTVAKLENVLESRSKTRNPRHFLRNFFFVDETSLLVPLTDSTNQISDICYGSGLHQRNNVFEKGR